MLRKIFTGLLMLNNLVTYGQWADQFADGNFTEAPEWLGEASKFEITGEVLHLNDPLASGSAYLTTPGEAVANATWEFYVEISENPSSTTFTRIYLMADQADISGTVNGYFVMIGGSQDEVSLYRQDGSSTAKIIDGADGRVDDKPVQINIRVTRDMQGNWQLFSRLMSETDFVSEGTIQDQTHTVSSHFGVYCRYTSTRNEAFYFDDFTVSGIPQPDTSPPTIKELTVLSATQLQLTFSENLESTSAQTVSHYRLDGQPVSTVQLSDARTVLLTHNSPLTNGYLYAMNVSGVQDEAGNAIEDTTWQFRYLVAVDAQWQDVIVNEWMPDPNPVVSDLPEAEFIELYNRSAHPFSLQGWTVNDKVLPDHVLLPGQYVILSPASADFAQYGAALELESWPTLPNGGSSLIVKDAYGEIVDSLSYAEDLVQGGYSLERIHLDRPCDQRLNYGLSGNPDGGTPGAQNSLFSDQPDTEAPRVQYATANDPRSVQLHFDEAVVTSEVQIALSPRVGVAQVQSDPTDEKILVLRLTENLVSGTTYQVTISQARDCYGNEAERTTTFYYDNQPPTIERVIWRDTAALELVFNEPLAATGDEEQYIVSNGVGEARSVQWSGDSSSVLVDFPVSLAHEPSYRLIVYGVTDRSGNTADSLAYDIVFRRDIDTVRVVSAYQVNVVFATSPTAASAQTAENYHIDRELGHPNVVVSLSDHEVQLIYDRPLVANKIHELQLKNLVTASGTYLGTPVYRFTYDQKTPSLDSVTAVDVRTLVAHFSEAMAWNPEQSVGAFTIDQGIASPERVELLPDRQSFALYLSRDLLPETTYELSVVGLGDRSGNVITSPKKKDFLYDQQPPSLLHWQVISPNQLQLEFHEPLVVASATDRQHYTLLPDSYPDSVATSLMYPEQVTLFFADPLPESSTILRIVQLADLQGNLLVEPIEVSINRQIPALGKIVPLSATALRLDFTKSVDAAVMETVGNYLLDSLHTPARVAVGGPYDASVTLHWTNPLAAESNHQLSIHRLSDLAGTTVESVTTHFRYDTKVTNIVLDGSAVTVTFTVPLNRTTAADITHYDVAEVGHPVAVILTDPYTVRLVFAQSFAEQAVYTLTLNDLLDQDQHIIPASQHRFGKGQAPGYHQLLISELMADPSPSVGLPEAEYVELFNASDQLLSTQGLRFSDAGTTVVLPTAFLAPQEHLILCNIADQAALAQYGRTLAVSTLPSLNSAGDSLRLTDVYGQEIFTVVYSDDWYNDAEKKRGGWSLEMVDTQRPCGEQDNWAASVDRAGGTPGRENSVRQDNPDRFGPKVLSAFAVSDTVVHVAFDERLDVASTRFAKIYLSEGLVAQTIHCQSKEVIVTLTQALQTEHTYSVRIENVTDCSGNLIRGANNTTTFVLPQTAETGDLLLSELLFRPRSGGEKFVELYNHSDKHIDLKDWHLADLKEDTLANVKTITNHHYVLAPDEYVALTEEPAALKADYPAAPEERLLEVAALPGLPVEEGTLVLLNPSQEIVQQFHYADRDHHPLLTSTQGVSLERITWDGPADNPAIWQSAAQTVNYATPGYRNSQQAGNFASRATLTVDPPVFAPGQAGRADFTRIHYQFGRAGSVANVMIYDAQGRRVRDLARNTTLAEQGFLVWDGTTDDHQRVGIGYYVIFFEIFDTQGRVNVFKEKVVVGGLW